MFRVCLTFALFLNATGSWAGSVFNLSTNVCSGQPSSSFLDGVALMCSGDFSVGGGSITADSKVILKADGSLTLHDLTINAPAVEWVVGDGGLSLSGEIIVKTIAFGVAGGEGTTPALVRAPGSTISIGGGDGGGIPWSPDVSLKPGSFGDLLSKPGVIQLQQVPAPSAYVSMLFGMLFLGGVAWRREQPRPQGQGGFTVRAF